MPIDIEVQRAIEEATKQDGQNDLLAKKIIAWLRDSSERELRPEEMGQFLAAVRSEIKLPR
jgi:hypothetical protein